MKIKSSKVNMDLNNELKKALPIIEKCCKIEEGINYEMTITSAKDGNHMVGSKHYSGNAIDIRIWDMKKPKCVVKSIAILLGNDFDIVLEKDHIHIEFDPKW